MHEHRQTHGVAAHSARGARRHQLADDDFKTPPTILEASTHRNLKIVTFVWQRLHRHGEELADKPPAKRFFTVH